MRGFVGVYKALPPTHVWTAPDPRPARTPLFPPETTVQRDYRAGQGFWIV